MWEILFLSGLWTYKYVKLKVPESFVHLLLVPASTRNTASWNVLKTPTHIHSDNIVAQLNACTQFQSDVFQKKICRQETRLCYWKCFVFHLVNSSQTTISVKQVFVACTWNFVYWGNKRWNSSAQIQPQEAPDYVRQWFLLFIC